MVGRVLACIAVAACALPKPPPPAPARQAVLGLSIKSMTLGNGLRIVLVDDPHASEVQVTMRYGIGASDDLDSPGMAHLVEHLMFEQTLGSQTIMAQLEENATYANAFTSYDSTTYVSRARPAMLDKLLSIEAVRLGFRCTTITDSIFEREREVVKQEIRLRDDATELLTALHGAVYPQGHPYRQPVGGTTETVGAITRQQACAFADSYYATNNAALVISGHLSTDQVKASLSKFLARIAKRTAASPAPVREAPKLNHAAPAPIDEGGLLVMWRMPTDPYAQVGIRALAGTLKAVIDGEIKGSIEYLELGDVRAQVFGYFVAPGEGETIDDVVGHVQDVCNKLPDQLGSRWMPAQAFDALRQRAIYAQYASLEDGSSRDIRLAEHVLAGREPADALAAEFRALRNLQQQEAVNITKQYFAFDNASIVRLTPSSEKKRGHKVDVKSAVHDLGQRRSQPDPAQAHVADATFTIPSLRVTSRVLPNGLKVVMLPISTVPTVDIRLVFGAGSADEPADKRGTAMLAAEALAFDYRHAADLYNFAIAGGSSSSDVTADRTSFVVRGVDMHVDYLLAGLRRWAVDGRYDEWADHLLEANRRQRKEQDDDDAVSDAWRGAVYGAQHPYARVGFMRHLSPSITVEDAEKFRASYFTPDNATLVIAGHVDVALADRWVDFLFADWQGRAQPRSGGTGQLQPLSLTRHEDLSQLLLRIAVPSRGSRAELLVVAAMLDEIALDARHQLGAAYAFDASLHEQRLSSHVDIEGWIDPSRTNEVLQLLRDRIAKLHDDPATAARAFVLARRRVLVALTSITGSPSLLAARAETDIQLGRAPLADLQTAKEVQALTIDQLAPILAELDLSRGAMLMRGPADPINAAFALLGRQATEVTVQPAALDSLETPLTTASTRSHEQRIRFNEIEDAITDQTFARQSPIEIGAFISVAQGNVNNLIPPHSTFPIEDALYGPIVAGEVGYRFGKRASAGLHLSVGALSGSYDLRANSVVYDTAPYSLIPLDISAYFHTRTRGKLWGGLTMGLHMDGVKFDADRSWTSSLGFGVELAYDVYRFEPSSVAIFARANAGFGSDLGYGGLAAGVAYHH